MRVRLVAAVLAVALFPGAALNGQWVGRSWDSNRQLTYRDVAIIRNTAQHEVHGRPADTVVAWTNPETGHSGAITLVRKFVRQGMPCEQIEYRITLTSQRAQRYLFNSCRQPDGTWIWPPGLCGSGADRCGTPTTNISP